MLTSSMMLAIAQLVATSYNSRSCVMRSAVMSPGGPDRLPCHVDSSAGKLACRNSILLEEHSLGTAPNVLPDIRVCRK